MFGHSKAGGGHLGATASTPITAPAPAEPTVAPSPPKVQEIPPEEAIRKAPEASGKRPVETSPGQRKKAKGKKPTTPIEETSAPKTRPKSMKELFSTHSGEDGRDYHVLWVSNRSEHAPDAPLEVGLTLLTHGSCIWQDGKASAKYARVTQIPQLATGLYTLPSEVLMDRAAKTMVLVDLLKQAIEDYKKSHRFQMGLVQMGWVSLEYGYQLALARFHARYPNLEMEDPFKLLPEDSNVSMVDKQPFDDSLLLPKE
ncbi:hypothetical protein GW17_00056729 [Ensete ventricosum]|nr:hypothetical protein GW17_00056729 [Ensete ventricosum]